MKRGLDQWISHTAPRLESLPRHRFAIFFAYMAERLMPLYVAFEKKHGWGDPEALRRQLDVVWSMLDGLPNKSQRDVLNRLEDITPSGEKFDSPDSTYAQDAVICVDAATRALTLDEELNGNWLEYAIEPIKTRVSIEQTGHTSVEGEARGDWDARLMADARVADFVRDCENMISGLEVGRSVTTNDVRTEARSKAVRSEDYIELR